MLLFVKQFWNSKSDQNWLSYEHKTWIVDSKPMKISLPTTRSDGVALPTIECLTSAICSVLSRFIIKSIDAIDYVTNNNINLLPYFNEGEMI